LNIPQSIIKEYLVPNEYCRPKIEIGNYYLKWNNESYGISQTEISELKKFLTNTIPFFDTSYELLNSFEKSRYNAKYRLRCCSLHKELSPTINISYVNKHISNYNVVRYELNMHPDGSTFIDRIEGMQALRTTTEHGNSTAKKADVEMYQVKPIFYLRWTLGELLFDRQGKLASHSRV
jgi:hypothetical protein